MASNTRKLKNKRKRKIVRAGKRRKRLYRKGTTPSFPIHPERAEAQSSVSAAE